MSRSNLRQFLYDTNKSEIDKYFEDQAKFYLEKQKLERIDNFNGYFDFLNNEFPCPVFYEGLLYKSVSHAFQAARSSEQHMREKISRADSVMEMYNIAEKIQDPPEWQKNRVKVMEILLRDKFRRNVELREKLRATETRELINTFADPSVSNLFWGIVDNKGQNQLGRLLENVRNDVHHNDEMQKWIFSTFPIEDDKNLLPDVKVEVFKGGEKIEGKVLSGKSTYTLGKLTGSDLLMTHESLSRRHAVLICDSKNGVCIIDLGSKAGTVVDGQKCNANIPYKLKINESSTIAFGQSTRKYQFTVDYTNVAKYLAKKKKALESDMKLLEKTADPNQSLTELKASLGYLHHDTVFVGGLPENPSNKEVELLLSQFGKIKGIRIPQDKQTGKNRPIAFVTFYDEKDCKKAVSSMGLVCRGRPITLKVAEKNEKEYDREHKREDRPDKERYKKRLQENEERINKAIERREKRKSKSRSRSRSKSDSRKRRDNRDKKNEKARQDQKKRKHSSSRSSSSSDSDNSRSRSQSKDKKRKQRERSNEKSKKNGDEKKRDKESNDKNRRRDSENRNKDKKNSKDMDIEKVKEKDRRRSKEKDAKIKRRKESSSSPEEKKKSDQRKNKDEKRSSKRSSSNHKERSDKDKKKRKESSDSSSSGSSSGSSRSGSASSKDSD